MGWECSWFILALRYVAGCWVPCVLRLCCLPDWFHWVPNSTSTVFCISQRNHKGFSPYYKVRGEGSYSVILQVATSIKLLFWCRSRKDVRVTSAFSSLGVFNKLCAKVMMHAGSVAHKGYVSCFDSQALMAPCLQNVRYMALLGNQRRRCQKVQEPFFDSSVTIAALMSVLAFCDTVLPRGSNERLK